MNKCSGEVHEDAPDMNVIYPAVLQIKVAKTKLASSSEITGKVTNKRLYRTRLSSGHVGSCYFKIPAFLVIIIMVRVECM